MSPEKRTEQRRKRITHNREDSAKRFMGSCNATPNLGHLERQGEEAMHRRIWLLGTTVVVAATGFALVMGSAAASSTRTTANRCALGSVRGIAYVTGEPAVGIGNLPFTFTSDAKVFGYRWNCSGGAVSVRLTPGSTGFDVKFAGNPGRFAVANVVSEVAAASVTRNGD